MADARIALWVCWWTWPLECLGTSECDCAQHQADDMEHLAIYRYGCTRDQR